MFSAKTTAAQRSTAPTSCLGKLRIGLIMSWIVSRLSKCCRLGGCEPAEPELRGRAETTLGHRSCRCQTVANLKLYGRRAMRPSTGLPRSKLRSLIKTSQSKRASAIGLGGLEQKGSIACPIRVCGFCSGRFHQKAVRLLSTTSTRSRPSPVFSSSQAVLSALLYTLD